MVRAMNNQRGVFMFLSTAWVLPTSVVANPGDCTCSQTINWCGDRPKQSDDHAGRNPDGRERSSAGDCRQSRRDPGGGDCQQLCVESVALRRPGWRIVSQTIAVGNSFVGFAYSPGGHTLDVEEVPTTT
jgi:hypothetical protein